jgi:DNA-binding CsgD family transcriptional regulator
MMNAAAARGNPMQLGLASHVHGFALMRGGALADAEASLWTSVEAAAEMNARFAEPLVRAALAETLILRGRVEQAAEVLEAVGDGGGEGLAPHFLVRSTFVRLYRACGETERAVAELEAFGVAAHRIDAHFSGTLPWRSELAVLIAAEQPERAAALVESELADAHRVQLPRAVGLALRARAALEAGDEREATLGEAVAVLERSPAMLELAQTLIELGSQIRRSGRRGVAREPLRRALELAHRCAAEPLIAHAGEELRAADGRPRSPWLHGAAALTASQLRVARLAAGGLSNQQIAETLFITIKTVEMHLTHAYRKLGSNVRTELPALLDGELGENGGAPGENGGAPGW